MTKTIKLSLAAVMAAGIATSASAANLEDAIKGVEVFGYIDYRLESKSIDRDAGATKKNYANPTGTANPDQSGSANEYAVNVTATSKVNDVVKATVSLGFDEVTTSNDGDEVGLGKTAAQDADPSINVSNAYFTFDLGVASVMAGKQAIPSAFVDKTDTAKSGAGVVALAKINDTLTVAAAHFMNNNIGAVYGLTGDSSVSNVTGKKYLGDLGLALDANGDTTGVAATDTKTTELVALAKAGMVNIEAHYNMTDVAYIDGGVKAKALFLKADADINGIKVGAKMAQASADSDNYKWADSSVNAIYASAKAGTVGLSATYFTADKEVGSNNVQTDVALDGDNDSDAHVKVWQLSTAAIKNKGAGYALTAGMPVADKVDVKFVYGAATDDATATAKAIDYTETMLQANYKMSKNFKIHARYSILDKDSGDALKDEKTAYSRVQVNYTF